MLHAYGMMQGIPLLRDRRFMRALRYFVVPVNYWRTVEYRLICQEGCFRRGERILDIGSPKLLALYLADRVGAEVFATDIESYFISEYELLRSSRGIPDDRLHLMVQDGRRLRFPDDHFDKVYSISVVEHIPDDGDTQCLREMGRVLARGGRCILTVPFSPVSRTDLRAPDFYWGTRMRPADDGRVFYQRRYSEADLFERLIEPSGLALRKLEYVGERVLRTSSRELVDFLSPATGPIQPLLSSVFHTRPVGSWHDLGKPLCALVVLSKD
jgi:SAM-dependent methyltransferase